MNPSELFELYLRDHHAASKGGIALAQRIVDQNEDNVLKEQLSRVAREIVEDRGKLEELMRALEVAPSRLKQAGAWLGEKVTRLKLNGRVFGYSPLSRLMELEGLASAIRMKRRLWESLEIARRWDSRLQAFDFSQLIRRAEEQMRIVDDMHRQAVEAAFTPAEVPAQTA
jgi:hypothetical protein